MIDYLWILGATGMGAAVLTPQPEQWPLLLDKKHLDEWAEGKVPNWVVLYWIMYFYLNRGHLCGWGSSPELDFWPRCVTEFGCAQNLSFLRLFTIVYVPLSQSSQPGKPQQGDTDTRQPSLWGWGIGNNQVNLLNVINTEKFKRFLLLRWGCPPVISKP